MRSTIPIQSELCLSRLVFSLRVIVLMFICVYLGCARCLRAMTRKMARKPRSSHPCFVHFFSGCCFLCRDRPSLPLYFFWLAFFIYLDITFMVITHRWEPCFLLFSSFFLFSITFTSPSQSNLPTHLSRGLGWLRLWCGLLQREFVQLARNTELALIWSRSLCSTSFCNLFFLVPQGRCQFSFIFICNFFPSFF